MAAKGNSVEDSSASDGEAAFVLVYETNMLFTLCTCLLSSSFKKCSVPSIKLAGSLLHLFQNISTSFIRLQIK